MPYQNSSFSPPGNSVSALPIPAIAGAVPVVIPHHVAQFRRDFPAVARCLDAMRLKAGCVSGFSSFSAAAVTRAGGSEE